MDFGKLTVDYRASTGKNEAKRLRASGRIPGICYGMGGAPVPISLNARDLKRALDPERRQNTVIQVTVTGVVGPEGGKKDLTVMLKDYQVDAIRRDVQHVDLVVVDVNKDVTVDVPVLITGRAQGVIDGGQLHTVHRTLTVTCRPAAIPVKLDVDITALKLGEAIHVRDLKLPAGLKAAMDPGETVASIVAPRAEKSAAEEAAETAAAEGIVPVAGAAPAAGAAAAPTKEGAKAEAKPAGKEAKPAGKEAKK